MCAQKCAISYFFLNVLYNLAFVASLKYILNALEKYIFFKSAQRPNHRAQQLTIQYGLN